ncbi:MAG TPA: M14 metallopeptidase family protein [Gemmatimonadaceae bacterium]
MSRLQRSSQFAAALLFVLVAAPLVAQGRITSPKDFFGFNIGDDYQLATYTQFEAYWKKIDAESNRMRVEEIGKTAEGRPQLMAIITAPENHARLARYKEIAGRLALAEGLTDQQARALAREGKAIVWFDGGLHATEVLGAHQLIETTYQLVSRNDEETQRILRDNIILAVHANPDGMELVSSWYMRNPNPQERSSGGIPRLYQKYIGHDNNRDFYILNQNESINVARIQYHEWFPQIIYNHHQTGPAGTVMFAPPFRDPFNYHFDPLVVVGLDLVSAAMHERFIREGKPGVTMRSGASYSTWWNGGLRTTAYFHNMIGILTETIGNPTPIEIPLVVRNQLPRGDLPAPITPQRWHFRQSIDYSVTANYALFDIASRRREDMLFNTYKMGKNAIERGNTDTWTNTPREVAVLDARLSAARQGAAGGRAGGGGGRGGASGAEATQAFTEVLRNPADRNPRGYILPGNQPDFLTATKFVNALRKANVQVERSTAAFTVAGKSYPAGSYVVKAAQAFRPHVLDMFEPQDHPDDFAYPGGPPRPPYDNAGWTLAYQMGVQFDRILDGFDCPCTRITGMAVPTAGTIAGTGTRGLLLSHDQNDAFVAVNRALNAGAVVHWLKEPMTANGRAYPAGSFYIEAAGQARPVAEQAARELGLTFDATGDAASAGAVKLSAQRVGLWDQYGGSMPSGHTRWLLEQFEFPFQVIFPPELDAGNLRQKFDVIVFVTGAIPSANAGAGRGGRGGGRGGGAANIPAEYRDQIGSVTAAQTVPQIRRFMEEGGTVIAIGSSTNLAGHLGLPVADYMVERMPNGAEVPLPREKFYVPGSLLRVAVDNTLPITAGLPNQVDVMFDDSPVFRLDPDAAAKGVKPLAWFDTANPLRSGWAWGQNYLQGGTTMLQADVGSGKLYMFGPEILFRAQPAGTFKFLFNGIFAGLVERSARQVQ